MPGVGNTIRGLRGLGLVCGSAVVWGVALRIAQTASPPMPLGLFVMVAAVGLPAFFAAVLAYRWRLKLPVVWAAAGYCLGSGLATGLSYLDYARSTAGGATTERFIQAVLTHVASATILVPVEGGGFYALWGNLLGVAIVVVLGLYGIETYRGRGPVERKRS